jgi:hypothetical protein
MFVLGKSGVGAPRDLFAGGSCMANPTARHDGEIVLRPVPLRYPTRY